MDIHTQSTNYQLVSVHANFLFSEAQEDQNDSLEL